MMSWMGRQYHADIRGGLCVIGAVRFLGQSGSGQAGRILFVAPLILVFGNIEHHYAAAKTFYR